MEISFGFALLLIVTGFIAGIINTMAGGGSNLTLPALMVMGLPADIANATNRVGVVLQNLVALLGFRKHDKLPTDDLGPILVPTMIGGAVGAVAAAYAPNQILKPLLLGTMLLLTLVMLLRPQTVMPEPGTVPFRVSERPQAWLGLFIAGLYGGFVQAGVGFLLITAIAGTLSYDLVRTNALKVVCVFLFTLMALLLFIWRGQVLWVPGLVLACGTMLGAHLAVRITINLRPETLRWLLFIMTLCACIAAMWL